MGGFSKHQITTAAEVLKLDEARKALRHIARAEGFYEQAEQKYDPNNLPLMAKNVRMLRKMRDITDEQYVAGRDDDLFSHMSTIAIKIRTRAEATRTPRSA